jgi:hypothetical protein
MEPGKKFLLKFTHSCSRLAANQAVIDVGRDIDSHLSVAPTLITEMSYTKFAALFMVTLLHHALCTRPWTPIL